MAALAWSLIHGLPLPDEAGSSRFRDVAKAAIAADFKAVLLAPEARDCLDRSSILDEFVQSKNEHLRSRAPVTSSLDQAAIIVLAVALLQSFIQANFTGPELPFSPVDLLPSDVDINVESLNAAALPQLTLQGEPAYHLSTHPILLLLAKRLFESLDPSDPTVSWWLLRLHLVHQSLLDEPVAVNPRIIAALEEQLPTLDRDDRAMLHVELGLLHHSVGNEKAANAAFLDGARESGLEFELTGALGKKTKFQTEAVSQLVLLAESRERDNAGGSSTGQSHNGHVDHIEGKPMTNGAEGGGLPTSLPLNDDTLLEETEFTRNVSSPSTSRLSHLDPSSQPPLHPLDQSLLLGLCLSQHNNTPTTGLTASQMLPFLSRVLSHPLNWSIHTTALLLRSRLESARSRTVERSTLQLAALIDQMPTSDSTPAERLRYFHQLPLPAKWEMERELAKRYLSLGITRSALEIFTRLEMWEDVVGCLQRLEKEEEAERVVKDLLEGRKIESDLLPVLNRASTSEGRRSNLTSAREAKLWCLLGDIALAKDAEPGAARDAAAKHYDKAWEISKNSSSRAMRSLGALRMGQGRYEDAAECLEKALAINPLYARTWFSLGVCWTRLERWTEARDAFRRGVGVDEEDGEMWNNLAAVYLRLNEDGASASEVKNDVDDEEVEVCRESLRHAARCTDAAAGTEWLRF